ncbi:hypothetical protein Btru_074526 [Bulinus truncatus]|nr:hypothetical protein Btru_074526 [Bulinus truncatus]
MRLIGHFLVLSALVLNCQAGVQSHDPQDLQTAFNLFNWLKGLVGSNGSGNQRTEIKYNDNLVTKCPPNVMFVLDGSDSVSPIGFTYAKTALVREIRAVTRSYADAHVGVILFSDVTEEIALKARTSSDIEELVNQVNALKQPRRKTAIPTALRRARQILLEYSNIESRAYNGERSGNIIVLLSDGNPDNQRATISEAKIAKDREILIISLSLEEALLQLLQDISHVVQEYRTAINWPSLVACPGRVLPPVPRGSGCRDILFVVDGSDSVLRRQDIVRQYLTYSALRFRLVANAIGVNIYGTDPNVQPSDTRIRLEEDKYKLAEKIRLLLKFPKSGGTGSDIAIKQSMNMLDDDIRGRPSTLVLIIDGPPIDLPATRQAIQTARVRGYPVIIIRVGTALSDEDLNTMSGGLTGDVYSVNSFTDLYSVDFDHSVCKADSCGVSSKTCVSPYIFDQKTCSCACPEACPYKKTHDANCQCVCLDQCPNGKLQDANCNCYCPPTNCPSGQLLDNCTCMNSCPGSCPSGQIFNAHQTQLDLAIHVSAIHLMFITVELMIANVQECVHQIRIELAIVDVIVTLLILIIQTQIFVILSYSVLSGSTKSGNTCVCYSPYTCKSGSNTCDNPLQCPSGSTRSGNTCTCAFPYTYNSGSNSCDPQLQCPSGSTKSGNTCVMLFHLILITVDPTLVNAPTLAHSMLREIATVSVYVISMDLVLQQCYKHMCVLLVQQDLAILAHVMLFPYTYNSGSNSCEIRCPTNAERFGTTCRCFTPYNYNSVSNTCDPQLQCPSGSTKSGNTCVCYSPYTYNSGSNTCDNPLQCPSGSTRSGNTCTCAFPYTYNSGSNSCEIRCPTNAERFGTTCRCFTPYNYNSVSNTCDPQLQCPSGSTKSGNTCVCYSPYTYNSGSNTCDNPLQCPSGSTRSGNTCTCAFPYTYNSGSNSCEIRCPTNAERFGTTCRCFTPYNYNSVSNTCDPQLQCPSGSTKSGNTCVCYSPYTYNSGSNTCDNPLQCPSGSTRSGNTCTCAFPYTYNSGSNSCEIRCPTNAERFGTTCRCFTPYNYNSVSNTCDNLLQCPSGSTRSGNTCTCAFPYTYNSGSNSCDNPLQCPSGSTRSGNTCTCAFPYAYNSGSNSCECTNTCPFNAQRNNRCECVCNSGLVYNSASNTCAMPSELIRIDSNEDRYGIMQATSERVPGVKFSSCT